MQTCFTVSVNIIMTINAVLPERLRKQTKVKRFNMEGMLVKS